MDTCGVSGVWEWVGGVYYNGSRVVQGHRGASPDTFLAFPSGLAGVVGGGGGE